MSIDEKIVEVGPLQWFYRETNPVNKTDKPPVLLLHGLPSQSFTWTAINAGALQICPVPPNPA